MFAGTARRRDNCRVYQLASVGAIALKGDDPDFIILETLNLSFQGATVTLPNTAPIGKTFTFILTANPQTAPSVTTHVITINVPSIRRGGSTPTIPYLLGAGQEARFIYTPNGWLTPRGMASTGSDGSATATALASGYSSSAYSNGVAFGASASGGSSGAAFGYLAIGASNGAALGREANTNGKDRAVALGYGTKCERYRELAKSADGAATCLQSFSILDWYGDTADATPTEILLGGTASQFAVLLNTSAFMFKVLVAARNNADDVNSFWELTGGIKRGANAAATAIVGVVTKTITAADAGAATWDIAATADTTNGSLKLTVTGEAAKTIRWNARGDISELRF